MLFTVSTQPVLFGGPPQHRVDKKRHRLMKFHTTPRFVTNMSFPLPIFSSTLLLERATLITAGVFSRIKPKLGLSLSLLCLFPLSSLSKILVAPPPRSFSERLRLPSPGKTPHHSRHILVFSLLIGFQVLS